MCRGLGESRHCRGALFVQIANSDFGRRSDKRFCRLVSRCFVIRSRLGSFPRPSFPGGSSLHSRGQGPHPLGGRVSLPAPGEGSHPRFRSGVLRGPLVPEVRASTTRRAGGVSPVRTRGLGSPVRGRLREPALAPRERPPVSLRPHPSGVGATPPSGPLVIWALAAQPPAGSASPAWILSEASHLSATLLSVIPAGHPNRELSPESRTPQSGGVGGVSRSQVISRSALTESCDFHE